MSRKFRSILRMSLLALLIFGLTACAFHPEDVKLAGKSQLKKYAKQKFGRATLVSYEEGERINTATFTDKQYGFTYFVSSKVRPLSIDGGVFGYGETKSSDFEDCYYALLREYLTDRWVEPDTLRFYRGSNAAGDKTALTLTGVDSAFPERAGKELCALVTAFDTRGYFAGRYIPLEDGQGNYIGSCLVKNGKYTAYGEELIEQMTAIMKTDVRNANNQDTKEADMVKYLSYEVMRYADVPGIERYEPVRKDMTPDTPVYVYYFDYRGSTYLVANQQVWTIGNRYYSTYSLPLE